MLTLLYDLLLMLFAALPWAVPLFFWPTCVCCGCDCPRCDGSSAPCEYQVEISGMANGSCALCAGLDGTYIIPYFGFNPSSQACNWQFIFDDPCRSSPQPEEIDISLGKVGASPTKRFIRVQISSPSIGESWLLIDALGTEGTDCKSYLDYSIPVETNHGICDNSAATCLLTSI